MSKLLFSFIPIFLLSCNEMGAYAIKYFCFPPNLKPHEGNCEYVASVYYSGNFTRKSAKTIKIAIQDKDEKVVLDDQLTVECISMEVIEDWKTVNKLSIKIGEVGNPHVRNNTYNNELLISGARPLYELYYNMNKLGRFERVKTDTLKSY